MKVSKFSWIGMSLLVAVSLLLTGCNEKQQINNLKLQNRTQAERVTQLEAQLRNAQLETSQLRNKIAELTSAENVNIISKDQEIQALQATLAKKNELIARMQTQLLQGGVKLPMELSVMLEDFAKTSDIVTFDEATGKLKFKSDLLFASGSDVVNETAAKAIAQLSDIMKTKAAANFDIIVAGHTDDVRIRRAATKAKHPTNWHLSADRAISVLLQMSKDGIKPQRLSIRAFGEFKPIAPNKAGKKGNPKNRRVEIFIVPKGK